MSPLPAPARDTRAFAPALVMVLAGAACSPALDWREARPEGGGATLMFPCRAAKVERTVRLADASLRMQLHSCSADGATYSLAFADARSPERVSLLLQAWQSQSVSNVAGRSAALPMQPVAGATPNLAAGFFRIEGRLPDARPVVEHAAFFVRGARLYQAAIVSTGKPAGPEAIENFFGAIRLQ